MEKTFLTSWKEIANYLGKGVRTVQRWERKNSLPVHRPCGKGIVAANSNEIDAWLNAGRVVSAALSDREVVLLREIAQLNAECERLRNQLALFRKRPA